MNDKALAVVILFVTLFGISAIVFGVWLAMDTANPIPIVFSIVLTTYMMWKRNVPIQCWNKVFNNERPE